MITLCFRHQIALFCFILGLNRAGADNAPTGAPDAPAPSPELNLHPLHTIADAHPKGVAALAIFDGSRLLMSAGHSREAKVWDVKTGTMVLELPMQTSSHL